MLSEADGKQKPWSISFAPIFDDARHDVQHDAHVYSYIVHFYDCV